jgi:serine/threonine protein kinase
LAAILDSWVSVEKFGPYELMERIAVGGMAEIFLARRCGPGGFAKVMALKRVLPELARQSEFRQMFADEARLCASLSHPGLVQVFDYGEVEDTPYLAMEWIDGGDLTMLLGQGGPLPTEAAAFIMAEVARALAYVHDARDDKGKSLKIVHRDLSPGNILISRAGDVKLGDFGVAKARGRLARTEAGQLKGTLAYLAPEQVGGGQVDERTDVYAVGLLLFELLAGERYVQGDSEVELLKAASNPTTRLVKDCCPEIPEEVEALLARALALDPEQRFPNAEALEHALRRLSPDTSKARAVVEERVREATGDAPKRRQTELMCYEPEPSSRDWRRALVPVIAIAGLIVILGSLGLWRFLSPTEPERAIVTAPPEESSSLSPIHLSDQQRSGHGDGAEGGVENPSGDARPSGDGAPLVAQEAGPGDSSAVTSSLIKAPLRANGPRRPAQKREEVDAAAPTEREVVEPSNGQEAESPPPEVDDGPDLARLLREADQRRTSRGIVAGDDRSADQLRARAAQLIRSSASPSQAEVAVTAYRQRLDEVTIDRAFIDRKMQRVSRRIATLDANSTLATQLNALSQQALRRAMSGDYEGANRILNQILSRARQ